MKKLNYIFLSSILLSILAITSCEDFKTDDIEAPQIEDIFFNEGDTILVSRLNEANPSKPIVDTIYYNGSENTPRLIKDRDILVVGHRIWFSGKFFDNENLSSAFIRIWGDTTLERNNDSIAYQFKILPNLPMQGGKEFIISRFQLGSDIIPISMHNSAINKNLPLRQGDEYRYSVHCVDVAGNQNSTSYAEQPIVILYRDSVINLWKKQQVKLPKE